MQSDEFSAVDFVNADAAMWERVRASHQALAELSDDELGRVFDSYVNTRPSISEVLFKTPVGPVILINIVCAVTGLSWCDLPFVASDSTACAELAARTAAQ